MRTSKWNDKARDGKKTTGETAKRRWRCTKTQTDTDGQGRTNGRTEQRELSRQAKRDSKKHAQLSSVCRSQGRISVCVCVSVCKRRGGGICADSWPAVAALAAVCPMRSAVCRSGLPRLACPASPLPAACRHGCLLLLARFAGWLN